MSMNPLRPCLMCSRHVRVVEASCPFCGAALEKIATTTTTTTTASSTATPARLGRAALFAFGTAASITAACAGGGPDPTGDASTSTTDASSDAARDSFTGNDSGGAVDTSFPDTGCIAKPYGAPPADGFFEIV